MAVLITGAGMIGSMAALALHNKGERPVLYDIAPHHDFLSKILDYDKVKIVTGDILDLPYLISTIRDEHVDRIIHTASLATPAIVSHPFSAIKLNIGGTATVLEAARLSDVKRVVFASTTSMYAAIPKNNANGYEEDFTSKCLSNRQKWLYPITKLTSEQIGLVYADNYGVDFVALRLSGVFGPWKGKLVNAGSAILMDILMRGPALGKPALLDDPWVQNLFREGKFDLLYSKDAGKALVLACFAPELKQKVYNISMGQFLTFDEVIATIKKVLPDASIALKGRGSESSSAPHVRSQPVNLSAARSELGYEPDYDMESSTRDYVDWIRRCE